MRSRTPLVALVTAGFLLFTAGPGEARFDFYDEFGKQLYSTVKRAP